TSCCDPVGFLRSSRSDDRKGEQTLATYVLVHGGGHGGWCYQRVSRILREAGHEVHAPSLTGLGERAHLLRPGIDLDLQITDDVELVLFPDPEIVKLYGVTDPDDVAWMVARLTPHPWKCFEQPLRLTNKEGLRAIPQFHIVCSSTVATRDSGMIAKARAEGRF